MIQKKGTNIERKIGKCQMEEIRLIRPTMHYAEQIMQFRQEIIDAKELITANGSTHNSIVTDVKTNRNG